MEIAAHLIVGPKPEPFLGALLESLAGAATLAIVNDNAPDPSPHAEILAASRFGKQGRLIVDRTPFEGFSQARNACMRIHRERGAGDWAAFVDADEVHGDAVANVAAHLQDVPPDFDFVDGYTWHFFASFDYYTSIERRMTFFRVRPGVEWEGKVHEHLIGLGGKRIALPYVYGHYGHTLDVRRHAEKGRLYSSLGAEGGILREDQLDDIDVAEYFKPVFPRLMHFDGEHPPAARPVIERLKPELRELHALTERIVRAQPLPVKMRNAVRKQNYELRWRGRALDPLARRLVLSP